MNIQCPDILIMLNDKFDMCEIISGLITTTLSLSAPIHLMIVSIMHAQNNQNYFKLFFTNILYNTFHPGFLSPQILI